MFRRRIWERIRFQNRPDLRTMTVSLRPNPKKNMVYVTMLELTITPPYVHSRVDSPNTFTMGIGQPNASVDLNPML